MSIHNYLKESTIVREELFNLKLFYDLKKAAAEREYHLKIFQSSVDIEGFDIILDDNQKNGRYQIKTRFNAKTRVIRGIHSVMLLPNKGIADLIRFDNGLCPTVDNGIIFIDIKYLEHDNEPFVQYYYTDFYIILMIAKGLFELNENTIRQANALLDKLITIKRRNYRIDIPIKMFLKLRDASSLLAISGFDCDKNKTLQYYFMKVYGKENKSNDPISVIEETKLLYKNILRNTITGLLIE